MKRLVAWEIALGVLMLSGGRAVRVALWAALFQVLALAPFVGWYAVANLATAVLVIALSTRSHDRTVIDVIRRREHSRQLKLPPRPSLSRPSLIRVTRRAAAKRPANSPSWLMPATADTGS